jgi:hypothetical protein
MFLGSSRDFSLPSAPAESQYIVAASPNAAVMLATVLAAAFADPSWPRKTRAMIGGNFSALPTPWQYAATFPGSIAEIHSG